MKNHTIKNQIIFVAVRFSFQLRGFTTTACSLLLAVAIMGFATVGIAQTSARDADIAQLRKHLGHRAGTFG